MIGAHVGLHVLQIMSLQMQVYRVSQKKSILHGVANLQEINEYGAS